MKKESTLVCQICGKPIENVAMLIAAPPDHDTNNPVIACFGGKNHCSIKAMDKAFEGCDPDGYILYDLVNKDGSPLWSDEE